MLKSICPTYCPSPFCLLACPSSAISTGAKSKHENVYLETGKCNGCGLCRVACMTFSLDRTLERKLPWLSARAD